MGRSMGRGRDDSDRSVPPGTITSVLRYGNTGKQALYDLGKMGRSMGRGRDDSDRGVPLGTIMSFLRDLRRSVTRECKLYVTSENGPIKGRVGMTVIEVYHWVPSCHSCVTYVVTDTNICYVTSWIYTLYLVSLI
ncbi:hypothetical protein J6590_005021 [Homalodisca vitripennis]|nr:hypothetical protein J6590_005021 [Homalodisca vitripennis]